MVLEDADVAASTIKQRFAFFSIEDHHIYMYILTLAQTIRSKTSPIDDPWEIRQSYFGEKFAHMLLQKGDAAQH